MTRASTAILSTIMIVFSMLSNPPTATAQSSIATGNDIGSGLKLAERLCSNCHAVSPSTSGRSLPARSFVVLANQPGQSEMRLAGAIIIPHPAMPSIALTRREIRDVVAYIMSLKTAPALTK